MDNFTCLQCKKTFKNYKDLIKHIKLCVLKLSFFCFKCNRKYTEKKHLIKHYKLKHYSIDKNYEDLISIRWVNQFFN